MIGISGFKFIIDDLKDRRTQFILACALGIGIGVSIRNNNGEAALGSKITDETSRIILDSGLTMGVLVAIGLNLILPEGLLGYEEMSLVKDSVEENLEETNDMHTEKNEENQENIKDEEQGNADVVEMGSAGSQDSEKRFIKNN